MKIAVATEDGVTVSQHFGRAPFYVVATVEEGRIVGNERRAKAGHQVFATEERHAPKGRQHGYGVASRARHEQMAEAIADCEVIIAGGMGSGAFESMRARGIEPVVTDERDIREAALRYAQGNLPNLMERLH
jgi:predicted Fe-Mo cluster-binding NifX family protein